MTGKGGVLLLRLAGGGGFLLAWAATAFVAASPTLPGPYDVAADIARHLDQGELLPAIGITMRRVALSFTLAMAVGCAVGIAMGRSSRADALFGDLLILTLNLPALVVIVLCYIWLGLTETAAITAVAVNKTPLVAIILREGARSVDPQLMQVGDVYRLAPMTKLRRILLPQLQPYIMSAARSGLSLVWKIVLVVEVFGRGDGVGAEIYNAFQFFDITSILSYALTFIAVILVVEHAVLRPLETRLTGWRR